MRSSSRAFPSPPGSVRSAWRSSTSCRLSEARSRSRPIWRARRSSPRSSDGHDSSPRTAGYKRRTRWPRWRVHRLAASSCRRSPRPSRCCGTRWASLRLLFSSPPSARPRRRGRATPNAVFGMRSPTACAGYDGSRSSFAASPRSPSQTSSGSRCRACSSSTRPASSGSRRHCSASHSPRSVRSACWGPGSPGRSPPGGVSARS